MTATELSEEWVAEHLADWPRQPSRKSATNSTTEVKADSYREEKLASLRDRNKEFARDFLSGVSNITETDVDQWTSLPRL